VRIPSLRCPVEWASKANSQVGFCSIKNPGDTRLSHLGWNCAAIYGGDDAIFIPCPGSVPGCHSGPEFSVGFRCRPEWRSDRRIQNHHSQENRSQEKTANGSRATAAAGPDPATTADQLSTSVSSAAAGTGVAKLSPGR